MLAWLPFAARLAFLLVDVAVFALLMRGLRRQQRGDRLLGRWPGHYPPSAEWPAAAREPIALGLADVTRALMLSAGARVCAWALGVDRYSPDAPLGRADPLAVLAMLAHLLPLAGLACWVRAERHHADGDTIGWPRWRERTPAAVRFTSAGRRWRRAGAWAFAMGCAVAAAAFWLLARR